MHSERDKRLEETEMEIRQRLSGVCSHMTSEEFSELVSAMAKNQRRDETWLSRPWSVSQSRERRRGSGGN